MKEDINEFAPKEEKQKKENLIPAEIINEEAPVVKE